MTAYPQFIPIIRDLPAGAGGLLGAVIYGLERTPLRVFGLSRFLVVETPAAV